MWSRMTAEGAKAPSDCSRIVIRLRYGIKRRSDRRGNEHGSKGRGAGTVAWNRLCPIDRSSGVSHGYQRTARNLR